jgi:hypothetical protein
VERRARQQRLRGWPTIEDRPADNGHRDQLLRLLGEGANAIIARDGVFRDPKPAGCFVVTRT